VTAARRPSWLRGTLLILALALCAAQTPGPWGGLWLLVPAAVAASLLVSWRFGTWGVTVPVGLLAAGLAIAGPLALWVWWIPVAALCGTWMGLREEGGGPRSGERAWMLAPLLLLAALLPWAMRYPDLVQRVERELAAGDTQLVELSRQFGATPDRLRTLQHAVGENAALRRRVLPHVLPSLLFVWMALLVVSGRSFSSRAAAALRWPPLSNGRLRDWRLPDGAVWVFLVGLGLLLLEWRAWAPSAWTLLLNTGLGYCVQGIAVVESLLLARGVPPSIIVLTMLFVFAVAMPVFVMTTAALGLSDVWLDYRRLESGPEAD
jgi:hypothetical protein